MDSQASREVGEETKARGWIPFAVAGVLLVPGWALLWTLGRPIWVPLVCLGWATLLGAMVLIALPLLLLPRKGQAPRGGGVTRTTAVVTTGIYAVIRHPLYLGWMLVYVALVLFAQHWLVLLIAVTGITCLYIICVQEERRLLERFGEEYVRYMRAVPRLNILTGVMRVVRRGKTK